MTRPARRFLQRNRLLWRLYKATHDIAFRRKSLALAQRLANHPDEHVRKVSQAVEMLATGGNTQDREWAERIERLRVEMLNSDAPLVDDTLGEPGIYDGGGKTIRAACQVSKPPRAAFFLYCLVRAFKSSRVLELGTNVGISSAYLRAAGTRNPDPQQVITLESSRYRQRVAMRLHKELGLGGIGYVQGLFSETLASVLEEEIQPDFAFIDGHHQFQPTLDYLNQIAACATSGCVVVFDDIDWSEGMKRAWSTISGDQRFSVILDFHTVGVCVFGASGTSQRLVSGPVRIF
jgi:predicted O-methyltransferase YrrM